ncbi:hypothetical protein [Corynebacterium heidelbergense]|uniref:Uncharacterized protein n=1 Tax=Corynebacterium heidelbergense TaxID=2055947 RepID=A0A364VE42_9CORY|nr:hypothetical protein [Corynebacterium heidelbergense]RAV34913.1 hypothetical protein CWC39_00820 [Corynebacterium heidelbergense]WCZ36051.1 hypothetical protein CHEID_02425 [Corynebacterium heidelbergense]
MSWSEGDEFNEGGKALFGSLCRESDSAATRALIVEAARAKDRLDRLHLVVRGDVDSWTRVFRSGDAGELVLKLDTAVSEQRQLATVFRQLLNEIRERQGEDVGDDEPDGLAGLS